ncbi:MAG: hypothetical protein WBW05_25630, partial [Candidatus Acidiferrum sp.]
IQLFNVGSVATFQTGGVAYAAHVGGAIFGMIFARRFEDPQRVCIGHLSPITTKSWTTRLQ